MTITLRNQAIANEVLRMFSIENTALEVELDAIQTRLEHLRTQNEAILRDKVSLEQTLDEARLKSTPRKRHLSPPLDGLRGSTKKTKENEAPYMIALRSTRLQEPVQDDDHIMDNPAPQAASPLTTKQFQSVHQETSRPSEKAPLLSQKNQIKALTKLHKKAALLFEPSIMEWSGDKRDPIILSNYLFSLDDLRGPFLKLVTDFQLLKQKEYRQSHPDDRSFPAHLFPFMPWQFRFVLEKNIACPKENEAGGALITCLEPNSEVLGSEVYRDDNKALRQVSDHSFIHRFIFTTGPSVERRWRYWGEYRSFWLMDVDESLLPSNKNVTKAHRPTESHCMIGYHRVDFNDYAADIFREQAQQLQATMAIKTPVKRS